VRKQSLNERAMNFLARREHSVKELQTKLVKADFDIDEVNAVIDKLITSNLQSDQRFTENYSRYRSQRGFGSLKIRLELKNVVSVLSLSAKHLMRRILIGLHLQ